MTALAAALFLVGTVVAVVAFFYFVPVGLWLQAWTSKAHVGLFVLVAMRLRRVPVALIVIQRIAVMRSGIDVSLAQLEGHFLASGDVVNVARALISAAKADIRLSFERAAAIDLAGRNVLEAVRMSVLPNVLTTPKITAMAKDGIQISAFVKVTVRADLDRLVGGATEETVMARVGEGVVTTIGSAESHRLVLSNPALISQRVLEKGLDAGTAFEILSIDIADLDVGQNIGAQLQADQARADKQVAQARAESRRAAAVALEQEMLARVAEMRARVVQAEAGVPLALASALRGGVLTVFEPRPPPSLRRVS